MKNVVKRLITVSCILYSTLFVMGQNVTYQMEKIYEDDRREKISSISRIGSAYNAGVLITTIFYDDGEPKGTRMDEFLINGKAFYIVIVSEEGVTRYSLECQGYRVEEQLAKGKLIPHKVTLMTKDYEEILIYELNEDKDYMITVKNPEILKAISSKKEK